MIMLKLLYFVFTIWAMLSCTNSVIKQSDIIVTKYDTIQITDTIYIENLNEINNLNDTIDSLKHYTNSINSELFVAKYKLQRISYYNKIAANKNNRKYLRGWINRVINDK